LRSKGFFIFLKKSDHVYLEIPDSSFKNISFCNWKMGMCFAGHKARLYPETKEGKD
jgi:hypothetical protein